MLLSVFPAFLSYLFDSQQNTVFSAAVFTDCNCIVLVVAEVDNAKQVPEESGDLNDEEEFGTNQMAEGSGRFVLPEPKGTDS